MILSFFSFGNRRKYNGITINVGIKITHIIIKRVSLFQNPFLFLWNNFHATIGLQMYLVGRYLLQQRFKYELQDNFHGKENTGPMRVGFIYTVTVSYFFIKMFFLILFF